MLNHTRLPPELRMSLRIQNQDEEILNIVFHTIKIAARVKPLRTGEFVGEETRNGCQYSGAGLEVVVVVRC